LYFFKINGKILKSEFKLLTAIINHNDNEKGIELKKRFIPYIDTILIDSGSSFKDEEKEAFDYTLPNVYYNGLLNKAHESLKEEHTHLFLITSDVEIEDVETLLERMKAVYMSSDKVGVYAPSAVHSCHTHQNNLGTKGIRQVTFTEGFCFVIPKEFLNEICPIDLEVNKIGHGIDLYMGYLSMKYDKWAIVDDQITVDHPHGSGYSDEQARIQRDNWFDTKSKAARVFHYWVSKDILKNSFGYSFVKLIMKLN
jgi:hypothetical protein